LKTEFVNDSFNTDLNFYPRGGALCPSIGATPAVTICSPREGATVASPVEITAGAVAAKQVISIAAEVDGKEVLDSEGANLDGFVELASGPHQLTVVARDAANAILQQTTKFVVGGSPAPPDRRLSIGVTPAKASISLGESANFVVSVGSDGGLTDQVTFACSNLPAGAQCSFEPSGMSAVNLPTTTKMKLSTKPLETGGVQIRRRLALAAILLIGVALVGAPRGYAKLLCSVLLAIALVGCAGLVEPTNRGTFTVTVVGKSGAVKKTVNIDLTLE
jgi:hypothetical protein